MREEIEDRRLRRMEKRISHLRALLRVTSIFGGRAHDRARARVGKLYIREHARLWGMLHPDGEPEDQAKGGQNEHRLYPDEDPDL